MNKLMVIGKTAFELISRRNLRLAEMKSRQNITVSEPTCLALR